MKYYILFVLLFCIGCAHSPHDSAVSDLLGELDDRISNRHTIERRKLLYLEKLKSAARDDFSAKRLLYANLYREYLNFDVDSAILYAMKEEQEALYAGDNKSIIDARLNLQSAYTLAGQYVESFRIQDTLDTLYMDCEQKRRYFYNRRELYGGLLESAVSDSISKEYNEIVSHSINRMFHLTRRESVDYLFLWANYICDKGGNADACIIEMNARLNKGDLSVHDTAILYYLLSHLYMHVNDRNNALKCLVHSAICDMSIPVREHQSLYELSAMLFEEGDIERAYKYIDTSLDDVFRAKVKMKLKAVDEVMPTISSAFKLKKESDSRRQKIFSITLVLMLILLASAVYFVYSEKRKVEKARKSLEKLVAELHDTNVKLKEANQLKELYIGQYVDLCSSYIGQLEKFRSHLINVVRTKGLEKTLSVLKSPAVVNEELSDFYRIFDESFLSIYPNFVDDFNSLLMPEFRGVKVTSGLNTELRVFALIRLGIEDSAKIAEFLRRSVSTIYNYRVKYRNMANGSRSEFEIKVKTIGGRAN